jgi:hypothetical protein
MKKIICCGAISPFYWSSVLLLLVLGDILNQVDAVGVPMTVNVTAADRYVSAFNITHCETAKKIFIMPTSTTVHEMITCFFTVH